MYLYIVYIYCTCTSYIIQDFIKLHLVGILVFFQFFMSPQLVQSVLLHEHIRVYMYMYMHIVIVHRHVQSLSFAH